MRATIEVLFQIARVASAVALIPMGLFLTLAIVGIGNATTDATPMQLYSTGGLYLGMTLICVAYGIKGHRVWLAWLLIALAAMPQIIILAPIMGN